MSRFIGGHKHFITGLYKNNFCYLLCNGKLASQDMADYDLNWILG